MTTRTYTDLWDAVFSECRRLDTTDLVRVAELSGIPERTMRAYLNGHMGIPYVRVRALAVALDIEQEVTVQKIPCSVDETDTAEQLVGAAA